jgi:hypothetical protein
MSQAGFEPKNPVFERAMAMRTVDRAATGNDWGKVISDKCLPRYFMWTEVRSNSDHPLTSEIIVNRGKRKFLTWQSKNSRISSSISLIRTEVPAGNLTFPRNLLVHSQYKKCTHLYVRPLHT